MDQPKYIPVFTVRLPLASSGLSIAGHAQFMLDGRVPRELLVKILKHAIEVIEAGRSPEQIAALKL